MSCEGWKTFKLSQVGNIVTGKTPRTSIIENYGDNIPFLTPSDDLSVKHIRHTSRKLSYLGLSEVRNCLLPPNSICVSCIGSDLGKVTITTSNTVTNQQINSIIPSDKFDPDFIYYALVLLGKQLKYLSKTSTAVPIINKSDFSNNSIFAPLDKTHQKKISAVLSSLDDKIELNNQINANLEQQAQAIFKSWFIDFEPFKNGEFVESELGLIPKGWNVGKLSDIGDIVGGSTPSKSNESYFTNKGISWITPKDLSNNKSKFIAKGEVDITTEGLKNSSAKLMPQGSILYSSRAPIGYIAIAKNDICTNQGFKSIVPSQNIGTEFIYYYLKEKTIDIESQASGSTFKEISGTFMKNYPVIIPDATTLTRFNLICSSFFSQQEKNEEENYHLSKLRDFLLPKLMSGEIEI